MTRFALAAAAFASASLLAATPALADGGIYQCAPNAPGGQVLTCIPAQGIAAAAPMSDVPAAPTERSLKNRTHNWLAPTGEMLRGGDAEVSVHEFVYATGAVGLTDNLELNFSMPVLPMFASVGGRVSLTPQSSPLKLVIGAAAYFPLFENAGDNVVLTQASATVGYTTDRLNLHATLSVMGSGEEDGAIVIGNVGGSFKIGRKVALMGELVSFAAEDGGGVDEDTFGMSMVGVKFMGESTDIDLGLVFPHIPSSTADCSDGCYDESNDELIALPAMTMTYKF